MKYKMDTNFKTGFVTLIARPNVGKSTLLNKIAGQKIAITTPVAQTTREDFDSSARNSPSLFNGL